MLLASFPALFPALFLACNIEKLEIRHGNEAARRTKAAITGCMHLCLQEIPLLHRGQELRDHLVVP